MPAKKADMAMGSKRALVVDDSRSARLVLKRLLEQHGIIVDEVESAEDALEYLIYTKPHAIFMDHMMPGMDGLEAVGIIKRDPATALIPIMMYTSKDGEELFLGQARALGAVGVLPKEVKPADLEVVLGSLRLIGAGADEADQAEETAAAPQPSRTPPEMNSLAREAADEAMIELLKPQLEQQVSRLHQSLKSDLRRFFDEIQTPPLEPPVQRSWPSLVGGVVLGALLMMLTYKILLVDPDAAQAGPVAELSKPAPEQGSVLLGALAQQRGRAEHEKESLLRGLEWALNRDGQYAPDELPFNDRRLSFVSELIQMLHGGGFQGVIHLTAHVGDFCLVQDDRGEMVVAPDDLRLGDCELFGVEAARWGRSTDLFSVGFANFANREPLVEGSRIRLVAKPAEQPDPLVEYPEMSAFMLAGEWNAIARQNQRIEVRLEP
ncbi:response regulator [Pseudomonas sp. gcc21]|uniref:response regulator n=1 Tax=Pseudomonas sp. gcc21 TaxID=2726989 RepID=UPI0014516690|nr:response regulator [Pseudomonas sp. gcc21]QJD58021.1 response regulator [Pseudomonas sp. gcc21]